MVEQWVAENIALVAGFIATGGVALWRISALEKAMKQESENARADHRRIYERLEAEAVANAELRGELRGKGVINGSTD